MRRVPVLLLLAACAADERRSERPEVDEACGNHLVTPTDDPWRYQHDVAYRRDILERDLVRRDNTYADDRFENYAVPFRGWDMLPERDPRSRPFTLADEAALVAQQPLDPVPADALPLAGETDPQTCEDYAALGKRVMFEYPLRQDDQMREVAGLGLLQQVGFQLDEDRYVGLVVFENEEGETVVGQTCAMCHTSLDEHGEFSGIRSNRRIDIGNIRLLANGLTPGGLPPELDATAWEHLDMLGPGRTDILGDGVFNPYAIPDMGGLGQMPFLHHNANWDNTGIATMAVRCETLFITSIGSQARIPRELSWAWASYVHSLPPSSPLDAGPAPEASRGAEVFDEATCSGCHVPPLFSSARMVTVEEVGTDPSAALSEVRYSGGYRIPTLRGVGRLAPYLHHGAFQSLEQMFDPERSEPGHPFGLQLSPDDRTALLAYLRSI